MLSHLVVLSPSRPLSILEPVRVHFASGRPKELLEKVKKFRTTR
jgi:hypothetical protein